MRTLRLALLFLGLLAVPSLAHAQATSSAKLAWDQAAPDLATANAYTFRQYPDGSATAVVLSPVTCSGMTSPFVCQVPFPAFTPGAHTTAVTAANIAGESLKSTPFPFTFVVIPSVPTNLRILP